MLTRSPLRRALAATAALTASVGMSVAQAPPVSADPIVPIDQRIDATAHVASLNEDIEITNGSFVGSVDLADGAVTGDITLPPASTIVHLLGLPAARATFRMVPVGPSTGTIDLAGGTASITSSFHIYVPRIDPLGLGLLNLSTRNCRTVTPITVTMSGPFNLTGSSTFSGEFTIPRFQQCGLSTIALNLLAPGPGNTFTATATPRT